MEFPWVRTELLFHEYRSDQRTGGIVLSGFFFAGVIDFISGGGGLITIPVMLAVGLPVHNITGTNQCSTWVGTAVAACKYVRIGNIHLKSAIITLPFSIIGSYIGARLYLMVPDTSLKIFVLVTVPIIAGFVFANKKLGEEGHVEEKSTMHIAVCSAIIGLVLGGDYGFYGPGADMFFMLAYTALLNLNLVKATGNTRFVIDVSSVSSVITYATVNAAILNLAIAATFFSMAGSYPGTALAIKNGAKIIRPIMFCVVTLLMVKLIADLLV